MYKRCFEKKIWDQTDLNQQFFGKDGWTWECFKSRFYKPHRSMRSSEIPASTRFYLLARSLNSKHAATSSPAHVAAAISSLTLYRQHFQNFSATPQLNIQPHHASKNTQPPPTGNSVGFWIEHITSFFFCFVLFFLRPLNYKLNDPHFSPATFVTSV